MIPIDQMPQYFQWLSYVNYIRFSLESSIADIYGFGRCEDSIVSNLTISDLTEAIPKSVMDQISNSNVINANAFLSTLNYFSGEVSNETQSIALINYGLNDDNLYEGIILLVIIMIAYRIFTYLFLLRKIRALT